MNFFYILIPILIIIFLHSYNVEGFNFTNTSLDNIKLSDNWCNCNKTCNLVNVSDDGIASGNSAIKHPNDETCDINFDFIEDLNPSGDRLQDLKNYCNGCLDIIRTRCRHTGEGVYDPVLEVDAWCGPNRANGRLYTGSGTLERCKGYHSEDTLLDMYVEYMGTGFGRNQILPCPHNQNIWQRWKRSGRYSSGGSLGSDRGLGVYDNID